MIRKKKKKPKESKRKKGLNVKDNESILRTLNSGGSTQKLSTNALTKNVASFLHIQTLKVVALELILMQESGWGDSGKMN